MLTISPFQKQKIQQLVKQKQKEGESLQSHSSREPVVHKHQKSKHEHSGVVNLPVKKHTHYIIKAHLVEQKSMKTETNISTKRG